MRLQISAHSSGVLSVGRPVRDSCFFIISFHNHFPCWGNFMSGDAALPSCTPGGGGTPFAKTTHGKHAFIWFTVYLFLHLFSFWVVSLFVSPGLVPKATLGTGLLV
jgi:hypothetical protein